MLVSSGNGHQSGVDKMHTLRISLFFWLYAGGCDEGTMKGRCRAADRHRCCLRVYGGGVRPSGKDISTRPSWFGLGLGWRACVASP